MDARTKSKLLKKLTSVQSQVHQGHWGEAFANVRDASATILVEFTSLRRAQEAVRETKFIDTAPSRTPIREQYYRGGCTRGVSVPL